MYIYFPTKVNNKMHIAKKNFPIEGLDRKKAGQKRVMIAKKNHSSLLAVKREFGCKWDEVPKNRFQELVSLLQRRIDNTILGRIKKKQGTNRYHSFEEHLVSK